MKFVQAVSTFLLLSVGVQSRLSSKYVSNLIKEEAGLVKDTLEEETKFAKDAAQERYGPKTQIIEDRANIAQNVAGKYEKKIEEDAGLYKDIIEGEAGKVIHDVAKTKDEALAKVEEEGSILYNATMDEYAAVEKIFNDEAGTLRKKLRKEERSYEKVLEGQAASIYDATMEEAETVKKVVEDVMGGIMNATMVEGANVEKTVEDMYRDFVHDAKTPLACTSHTHRAACFTSTSCQWCTSSVIKEQMGACLSKEQVDDVAVELSLNCERKRTVAVVDEVNDANMSEQHVDGADEDSVVVVEHTKRMMPRQQKIVKKFSV